MVRVRIGAGLASSAQLRCIAELSRKHGNGVVHVTTRQDFQIHDVKIEQTADVLEGLLESGLTSCGGGGNAVRNITACPRAGICPLEQFSVAPHALALAQYLLQFDSSCNLPCKCKIAFAGCSEDCARVCVADLGFFAHRRNGMKGFAVYAGGGLGADPAVAVRIDDFVEQREIFEAAEAVKRLFDRYGDRSNTHQGRLRYVLARFGPEEFTRLYRKERESIRRQGLEGEPPAIAEVLDELGVRGRSTAKAPTPAPPASNLLPEKDKHFYTLKLRLPLGDIPADDLARVAQVAEMYGAGVIRTTQQQDLLIPSIPKTRIKALGRELQTLSIDVSGNGRPKVVACPGASTCKLGLCLSRELGKAISDVLARQPASGPDGWTIRISGCPNSCSQHLTGDIGFRGSARRVNGRLMPCYDVFAGARMAEGAARLAESIGTLPAKRIPEFAAKVFAQGDLTEDRLRELIRQYRDLPAIPEDHYRDWGSDAPFSPAGSFEPIRPAGQSAEPRSPVHELDLRGVPCPLNLVKAKLAIEKIPVGDVIEIDLDEGEPIQNVPVSLGRQGQEILATMKRESHSCVRIRRKL
jgi:sulfite reductase (ferredoxin)